MESTLSDLLLRMKSAKANAETYKQTNATVKHVKANAETNEQINGAVKHVKANAETNKQTNKSSTLKGKRKRDADEGEITEVTQTIKQLKANVSVNNDALDEIKEVTPKVFKSFVKMKNNALTLDAEYGEKNRKKEGGKAKSVDKDFKESQLVKNLLFFATEIEQNVEDVLQRKEKEIEKLSKDREAFKKATIEEVAKFDAENKSKIENLQSELEEAKKKQHVGNADRDKAFDKLEKKYKLLKERKEISDVDQSVMDKELAEKEETISKLKEEMERGAAERDETISKLKEEVDDLSGKLTQVPIFSSISFRSFLPFLGNFSRRQIHLDCMIFPPRWRWGC